MKREDIIRLLMPFVPSFQREFVDADLYGNEGWLFRSDGRLPENGVIPDKFLEGTIVTQNGFDYEVISKDDLRRRFENQRLPEGRSVSIDYYNFPGNPHLYGKIEISGVELVRINNATGDVLTTTVGTQAIQASPELKDARYNWVVEPCRVLPQEEIDANPMMWDMSYPNTRTGRFTDVKELIATAIIACLKIVQGPLFLTFRGEYVYREDDCFLKVDRNDEVLLKPLIIKRFNLNIDK